MDGKEKSKRGDSVEHDSTHGWQIKIEAKNTQERSLLSFGLKGEWFS
jgi:hypothetical protein